MTRYFLPILFFLFISSQSKLIHAQSKNIETQELAWARYSLNIKLDDMWTLKQEVENRFFIEEQRQHQFLSRTLLEYDLGKGWSIAPGFTYFVQTLPEDPSATFEQNLIELRPQLEIMNRSSLGKKLDIIHRYWFDFRFFENRPGSGEFEYDSFRPRYRIEFEYDINSVMTFNIFDEILLNVDESIVLNTFDQNRLGAALTFGEWKGLSMEFAYLNWFEQTVVDTDYFNRHIGQFSIKHNLKFKRRSILD